MSLPEYWPVLEPENIHYGWYNGDDNEHGECHCLIGWCMTMTHWGTAAWTRLVNALQKVTGADSLPVWNDTHTKADVAAAWNDAGRLLGYDIDNPEDA